MHLCFILLLVLICSTSSALLAQRVVVSQEISVGEDDRYEVFAGPGDLVILYRDDPNSVSLNAFNANMEEVWSRDLTLDRARPTPIGALISKGETVVFYTYRKERGLYLKLHRYSDSGNLTDSLTICELKNEFLTPNYALNYDDGGKYAIFTHQRDVNTTVAVGVEVATGRLLYEQKIDFSQAGKSSDNISDGYVDDSGSYFVWTHTENRRTRLEDHALRVFRLDISGQIATANVPLPELLVYDLELGVDEINRRVVLGGYYAENVAQAAGVMLLRLNYDLSGEAELVTSPFTTSLITSVDPKDRKATGIENLDARDLVFRRDGGVLIIGEQRLVTIRTVGTRGGYFGSSMKTDYLFEDIVLSTVGTQADGKGDWFEVLPKKQFSQDDGAAFSSYFISTTPSQMRLIYNDEVRSGGTVSEYTLNGIGAIERHSLMNTEYQNLWLRHEAGVQLSGSEIVIPSERRNKLRLVRLSY